MKTVIRYDNVQAAVALIPAHNEQTHRFIIHAHQINDSGRLFSGKEKPVRRRPVYKTGVQQVKAPSGNIIVQIGIKAQKAGQAEEKDQMEIRKVTAASIEPANGIHQIGEQRGIAVFFLQRAVQKLGKKHGYAHLIRMIGQAVERIPDSCLADGMQAGLEAYVRFNLHQRERAEQNRIDRRLARTADSGNQKRNLPVLLGIYVCDVRLVAVFHHIQHNSMQFLQHYL